MTFTTLPLSDAFDLIYPFPLPEDLCIVTKAMFSPGFDGRPAIVKPPTPPAPVYKRSEDILEWNVSNFGRMHFLCYGDDASSVTALVEMCSSALKYL